MLIYNNYTVKYSGGSLYAGGGYIQKDILLYSSVLPM